MNLWCGKGVCCSLVSQGREHLGVWCVALLLWGVPASKLGWLQLTGAKAGDPDTGRGPEEEGTAPAKEQLSLADPHSRWL